MYRIHYNKILSQVTGSQTNFGKDEEFSFTWVEGELEIGAVL